MQNEKRYLTRQPSFYECAMQRANEIGIFNRTTLPEDFYLTVFWCRYIHYSNQLRIRPNSMLHSHSFFELHCILNGALAYNGESERGIELSAGDFLLISPGCKHYLKALSPDAETFALAFEPICRDTVQGKRLEARFGAVTHIASAIPSEVYELIEQIMTEFHNNRSFGAENVKQLLNVLVTDVIRSVFESELDGEASPPSSSARDPRVTELEKLIADNPSRLFKVSELARHLNITSRQLNNVIQNDLGITAKELIDVRKNEQARKLLLETELTLREISESIGFSEHNNFNRFFKRMEGLSPGVFRKSRGK